MKTLALASFSLLCLGCVEALAAEPSTACRDEVAAAFDRLMISGQPYRKDVMSDVSDSSAPDRRQIFHGTAEFLPPDRMRESYSVTTNGVAGWTDKTIRVGERVWSNWTPLFWGWREWGPFLLRGARSVLGDIAVPADAVFECLGRVEFEGTAYLGYRARLDRAFVMVVPHKGTLSDARQQELERKFQQMPQEWRTVFVDPQSALPAYDLAAQANQLDNPSRKVQYTYPNHINIGPPLWCLLGLCRSILH